MGLADIALELLYTISVLQDLGHVFDDEPEVGTKYPKTWSAWRQINEAAAGGADAGGPAGAWMVGKRPLPVFGGVNESAAALAAEAARTPVWQSLMSTAADFQVLGLSRRGAWGIYGGGVGKLSMSGMPRGDHNEGFASIATTSSWAVGARSEIRFGLRFDQQPTSNSHFMLTVYDAADRTKYYKVVHNRPHLSCFPTPRVCLATRQWPLRKLCPPSPVCHHSHPRPPLHCCSRCHCSRHCC